MSATELGIDFVLKSPPCGKCLHRHRGGPCHERVDNLECKCWNWEAPHPVAAPPPEERAEYGDG